METLIKLSMILSSVSVSTQQNQFALTAVGKTIKSGVKSGVITIGKPSSFIECANRCSLFEKQGKQCFGVVTCGTQCQVVIEKVDKDTKFVEKKSCNIYTRLQLSKKLFYNYNQGKKSTKNCEQKLGNNFTIELLSAGYLNLVGTSHLKLANNMESTKYEFNARGYHVFRVDPVNANVTKEGVFDTDCCIEEKTKMEKFLNDTDDSLLIAVIVSNSAALHQPTEALKKLGATDSVIQWRKSYAFLAHKCYGRIAEANGLTDGIINSKITLKIFWIYNQTSGNADLKYKAIDT